ncbi:peptide-methionine (S)-S-oxide reductase MsrA [Flavobacteriaceae bacterium M23B6Z8]
MTSNTKHIPATFAGGCFWCTEAVFKRVKGVHKVISGYTGGTIKNPAYREICSGRTGHAEAIQIFYDENEISYEDLLDIFFGTHDPTTLNRQGNDTGTQYRSAIFYANDIQRQKALNYIAMLEKDHIFEDPIVTEVSELGVFYNAEDYHQDYYDTNKSQPYCQVIIDPKLMKLKSKYQNKLKTV